MTYITIFLALLNVTFLFLGVAYFRRFGQSAQSSAESSVESDAERSNFLFQAIHKALSAHAGQLSVLEEANADDDLSVDDIRRSNQETGSLLEANGGELAKLLGKYGNLYRSERQRIDSYAQNVDELDDLLSHFQQDAEGSNQVLLELVRGMLQENRQLQTKVSDCQQQVSQLIVRSIKSERDARTDALTKLPNRLAWDERLSDLDSETSIALVDVDDFKLINDGFGHAAGDAMLTLIGTILRNADGIAAYRIGGDEFALLIPSGSEETIADRIRKKIGAAVLNFANQKISVSVSIGVARQSESDPLPTVLRRADDALYSAKESRVDQSPARIC